MSEDVAAQLFDTTAHVQTTGTADEPGTGLGLLLCWEFVECHGSVSTVAEHR